MVRSDCYFDYRSHYWRPGEEGRIVSEEKSDSQELTNESIQSYEEFHQEQITEHAKVADAVQAYLAAPGQYGGSRMVSAPDGKLERVHYRYAPQSYSHHVNFHRYSRHRGRNSQRSAGRVYDFHRVDFPDGGNMGGQRRGWFEQLWYGLFGRWPWD